MRVLILGGTGVLSRPVYERCVANGNDTYVLNRGNTFLPSLPENRHLKADLRNEEEVRQVLGDLCFDVVVDFLSYTPSQLRSTLIILLGFMKQYVFISSATVYAIEGDEPLKEDHKLVGTGWRYAVDKRICEEIVAREAQEKGFLYTIIRPYVTYGETRVPFALTKRQQQWSVVNRIIKGKPILLWDDGTALCPLTYADDFAVGAAGLLGNKRAYGKTFHIASDEGYCWNDLIHILGELTGIGVPSVFFLPSKTLEREFPEYGNELTGDKARSYVFCNDAIKSAVPAFSCRVPLKEGLSHVLKYYADHPEARRVDAYWDGAMDRVIKKYCKDPSIREKLIYVPSGAYDDDERRMYTRGRSRLHSEYARVLQAIKQTIKEMMNRVKCAFWMRSITKCEKPE